MYMYIYGMGLPTIECQTKVQFEGEVKRNGVVGRGEEEGRKIRKKEDKGRLRGCGANFREWECKVYKHYGFIK